MKRQKKIIRTLTTRSFQSHKGRNLVAVIAIVLTSLMFTTLFVLSLSMSKKLVEMSFRQSGYDAHVSFKSITDEQIKTLSAHSAVKELGSSIVLGLAENKALSGRQVEMRSADKSYATHTFAMPSTGRMPEADNEVALDDITLDRLGIPHKLGQTVVLEWKKDMLSSEVTRSEFTLCGYWEGNTSSYASMAWVSEGFVLAACEGAPTQGEGTILGLRMAQITLGSDDNIEGAMDVILQDTGLSGLEYGVNLAYLSNQQSIALAETLPMYGGMVLVFLAGYLIIYNIFQISVSADIQFFGKLKTLGACTRQIKSILYGQANRLSLIGIPIGLLLGYLLGMVLVPVLIGNRHGSVSVSASPVIFIGSALFAWVTVLFSCLRPAQLAGKISPMEALRYSDSDTGSRRKHKKGKKGASLFRMGLANLGRNKKRTVLVVCSMTLGLVLLSCFYAKNASFDIDKYLEALTLSDFEVADATHDDYVNGYNPQGTTLRPELETQVQNLAGLEKVGRLYSQEVEITLSEQAIKNTKQYYGKNDRLSFAPEGGWLEGYREAMEQGKTGSVIYGCDGLVWDVLGDSRHLMDGVFDAEQFATGGYVMAVGIGTDDFSETMPTFSVGEVVQIAGKDYTVMGIVEPVQPIVSGASTHAYGNDFLMPADEFRKLWPENTLRKLYFNVSDDKVGDAQQMLTTYQQEVDSSMPITSRQSMEEQYADQTRSNAVMGNAISIIIALVGVLNFINSMVTAILSRRREFAMLQSVGMTGRQLRKMLVFEGLDYAAISLVLAYLVSSVAILTVVQAMTVVGYATFRFTLLPLLICTPILLVFAVAIPYICFKNLEKQSLVERLRNTD